jgi:hypothetical protein
MGALRAKCALLLGAVVLCALEVGAQIDYGNRLGRRVDEHRVFSAAGRSVLIDALDPTIQRWYLPQELFTEYGRRQWQYTNYARDPFLRYVSRSQEGFYFYDPYGDLITRGWLIYDWRQTQPLTSASNQVTKRGEYLGWFNRLIISSDTSGDYSYSIVVGDELFTTLTPLTFRKTGFNGVVTSLASQRLRATGLFSRISSPIIDISSDFPTRQLENATNLSALRLEADIGDHLTLGTTFVNSHSNNGALESFQESPFTGLLTSGQLDRRLELLVVRLSDDSPEDGEGGAVLFSDDVEITTTLMREVVAGDSVALVPRDTVITGSSIGYRPLREGGKVRDGFLTADGSENITLKYPLAVEDGEDEAGTLRLLLQQSLGLSLAEAEDAVTAIKKVRFRLILANDYRVEVASDRQTNPVDQPQFLQVARAAGNIKNRLNQQEVAFDYGLPTASQIYGVTAEMRDWYGFDFYGELNVSTRYRKYPTTTLKKHEAIAGIVGDQHDVAYMANLARDIGPWRFFLEGFGMDDGYSTNVRPVDGRGLVDYSPEAIIQSYDFVDDNDDNDRHPDQLRRFQGSLIPIPGQTFRVRANGVADPAVFPGYDENGDFLSDFNQNSNGERQNFFPDYDEPFLRYEVDRPEFLFGIDLNNNNWIDRFEDDDLPDYPYKPDRQGYNVFGGIHLAPDMRLTLGRTDEQSQATDAFNETNYAMFTLDRDYAGLGHLRVFNMLKQAQDTIPDARREPTPFVGAPIQPVVRDILAAQDTWVNTAYAQFDYQGIEGLNVVNKLKWEHFQQNAEDPRDSIGRPLESTASFLGLINKVDYIYGLGRFDLQPRCKSEFLRQTPFVADEERREEWALTVQLIARLPVMRRTVIESGVEQLWFRDRVQDEDALRAAGLLQDTGDWRSTHIALQLSTTSDYQGYRLTTQAGLRFGRILSERVIEDSDRPGVFTTDDKGKNETTTFITVFAGLE